MRILVVNCGSSSVKCAVIEVSTGRRLCDIRIEDVGTASCRLRVNDQAPQQVGLLTFEAAVSAVLARVLTLPDAAPAAVAHRVVHGGSAFVQPALIDEETMRAIEAQSVLAPLHNPPAIAAIRRARIALPDIPHVAVFDTAFHATLPARAREYALPGALTARLGIRRFGFHGPSHAHVAEAVAAHLHTTPQTLRIVSCHLGNGASMAAIEYGRSVETSMGMTPMEGLIMGTRAGDVDPGVLLHLLESGEFDATGLDTLLNTGSGLAGMTGTHDMRTIEQRAADGDESCRRAISLYAHRIRKYLGAYAVVMGGIDVIAFTGGIGEHSAAVRHRCTQQLAFLGAVLDEAANRQVQLTASAGIATISTATSPVRIMVVRADEELTIARAAAQQVCADPVKQTQGLIPVAISARHAHLSQATLDILFGAGYRLQVHAPLSQPGQFSAEETVTLIGPRGHIDRVRVLGPPREHDQIEISRSDEFTLGVDAPVRISGDLRNTPGITLAGPAGQVTLHDGVISARRHIHMSPQDAARYGVGDHDIVQVKIDSDGRDLIFGDVMVRVSPDFRLELHLDTDEANAAGVRCGDRVALIVRQAPQLMHGAG